jgi:hypothetical protein
MTMTMTALQTAVAKNIHQPLQASRYFDAKRAIEDPLHFEALFIGTLSAAVPADVWAEALRRAQAEYAAHRSK